MRAGEGLPGAQEVRGAEWIRVESHASPDPSVVQRCAGLGTGESGAIYLAVSTKADLVLVDEWRARRAAKAIGLSVAGTVGILEHGARLGKI